MVRLEFFVPMKVAVKGNSKKIAKFGNRLAIIGDDKARAAEESLVARLLEHRPAAPMVGPVRLDVTFVMQVPLGFPAWKRKAAVEGRIHPDKRPDRGNALKLLEDALSGAFYVDDAQVVTGEVGKAYGEVPGYRITLTRLAQATRESEKALHAEGSAS